MHPAWIEKIEESRRSNVILFWAVMVLVVVIPLMLIIQSDFFVILATVCFSLAGFRLYWLNQNEKMLRLRRAAEGASSPEPVPTTPFPDEIQPYRGVPTNPFGGSGPVNAFEETPQHLYAQSPNQHENAYSSGPQTNPFGSPAPFSPQHAGLQEPGPFDASFRQETAAPAGSYFTAQPDPGEPIADNQPSKPLHFHDRIANRRPAQAPPAC